MPSASLPFFMSLMAAHWPMADQELVKQAMEVDRRHDEQLLALQQAAPLRRFTMKDR